MSFLPGNEFGTSSAIPGFDKMVHITLFLILGTSVMTGFIKQYTYVTLRFYPVTSTIIYGMVLALLSESGQLVISNRSFDIFDVFSDLIGIICGIFTFSALYGMGYLKKIYRNNSKIL